MAKAVFHIRNNLIRARAINALRAAPDGSMVTIQEELRSLDQNAAWWPLLTDISKQAVHPVTGQAMPPEWWRLTLLDALGMECPPSIPSLDGDRQIPIGYSSSKLSVREFSDLIELTYKVGAELGVIFHAPRDAARANNPAAVGA